MGGIENATAHETPFLSRAKDKPGLLRWADGEGGYCNGKKHARAWCALGTRTVKFTAGKWGGRLDSNGWGQWKGRWARQRVQEDGFGSEGRNVLSQICSTISALFLGKALKTG